MNIDTKEIDETLKTLLAVYEFLKTPKIIRAQELKKMFTIKPKLWHGLIIYSGVSVAYTDDGPQYVWTFPRPTLHTAIELVKRISHKKLEVAEASQPPIVEKETEPLTQCMPISPEIPFETFWDLYGKKVGDKKKLRQKWDKLRPSEHKKIMEFVPKYKEARPDPFYRKDPSTFLNNKTWNDEIVTRTYIKSQESQTGSGFSISKMTDEQLFDELRRRGYIGEISKIAKL